MDFTLLTENQKSSWKSLVIAAYAGIKVNVKETSIDDPTLEAKSPHRKVPVLETSQGCLFEPDAIAVYLARLSKTYPLFGKNEWEAAQIENWICFSRTEIDLPANVWTFPILGIVPNNSQATSRAKGDIRKVLETLNKHLLSRTFLVGERLSVADLVVAFSLCPLYELVLDTGFRKQFANTNRWFLTVTNQPTFVQVTGQIKICEKMQVAPTTEEAPKEVAKEEKKPKEKKEQQPPKEKKEQPKKEEAPKKKEDEEEEDEFREEKKKSKLDLLPPSKFILDEWKRTYSNEDTATKAIPWLWSNLDKEGWSLWLGDYKYPNENEVLFKTLNLVGGFVQRLEGLRKYGFGTIVIFGQEPRLEIGCCMLVRGLEMPEELREVPDSENYNWRKVDPNNSGDVQVVNDYLLWSEKIDGRVLNQAKTFK